MANTDGPSPEFGNEGDAAGARTPQDSTQRIVQRARDLARDGARDYEHQKAMLEQGRIGHWLGSKQATTNIVAIVAVGLLSLIAISLVAALVKGIEIFTAAGLPLLSALTLILGYLFGRSVR